LPIALSQLFAFVRSVDAGEIRVLEVRGGFLKICPKGSNA